MRATHGTLTAIAGGLLAALLLTGCPAYVDTQKSPAAEAWATWGAALDVSAAVYEQVMISVGTAYGAGLITPSQLEDCRRAGRIVQRSLQAAKVALTYYGEAMARGEQAVSPAAVVLAAHADLLELLRIVSEYGVKYPAPRPAGGGE